MPPPTASWTSPRHWPSSAPAPSSPGSPGPGAGASPRASSPGPQPGRAGERDRQTGLRAGGGPGPGHQSPTPGVVMRVLYLSKALVVAAYRDKIAALRRTGAADVTAVFPERWAGRPAEPDPP